jgi:hypothetical protein
MTLGTRAGALQRPDPSQPAIRWDFPHADWSVAAAAAIDHPNPGPR